MRGTQECFVSLTDMRSRSLTEGRRSLAAVAGPFLQPRPLSGAGPAAGLVSEDKGVEEVLGDALLLGRELLTASNWRRRSSSGRGRGRGTGNRARCQPHSGASSLLRTLSGDPAGTDAPR